MFLLLEKNVGDLVPCLLIPNDDELPGLAVASRRSPAGSIENLSHHFVGNIFGFIVSTDASPIGGQFVKLVDV